VDDEGNYARYKQGIQIIRQQPLKKGWGKSLFYRRDVPHCDKLWIVIVKFKDKRLEDNDQSSKRWDAVKFVEIIDKAFDVVMTETLL
jgi:hypothetical protein